MDLISRENLKKAYFNAINETSIGEVSIIDLINNAPSMPLPDFKEGYKQAIIDGKTNFSKPQKAKESEIIKAYTKGFDDGVEIARNETQQSKWGKWEISEIRCPNCLEYFQTDCYSMGELKKCPVCDAKMIGEEE